MDWIADNVNCSFCNTPPKGVNISATYIANSTAIQPIFRRLTDQFMMLWRRKAFVHWYIGEGMEEMDFVEAESNTSDLLSEYTSY
jgi:tubulin beta